MIKKLWRVLRGRPTEYELELLTQKIGFEIKCNELRDTVLRLQSEADAQAIIARTEVTLLKDELSYMRESLAERRAKVADLKRIIKTIKENTEHDTRPTC